MHIRASGGFAALALGFSLVLVPLQGLSTDYRSTMEPATVLYDAPSLMANKVGLLGRDYPVELVVNLEGWAKIRDATGTLAWVQKSSLAERRMLLVRTNLAQVYAAPDAGSALVFSADQGVLLELMDVNPIAGFVKVKHRDGQTGYVKVSQVWGF